jgi:hypothetical protein
MVRLFIIFLFLLSETSFAQTLLYNDNFESVGFNWKGTPRVGTNTQLFFGSSPTDNPTTNKSNSPVNSLGIVGVGLGSSPIERDTISFPNKSGLDPSCGYQIRIRFCSYGINPTVNTAAGVDGSDLIQVGYSLNGGVSFIQEVRVTGISNAMWGYTSTGVVTKTSNNTLTTYPTVIGSEYSTIKLDLPAGISQVALNIILACNATGETWLIDDVELYKTCPLPIELWYANLIKKDDSFEIKWGTLSESNVDYFSILKTDFKGTYTELGRVKAAGFSHIPVEYSFIGDTPKGLNYLILREVDYDGYLKDIKYFSIFGNITIYDEWWKRYNLLGQQIK